MIHKGIFNKVDIHIIFWLYIYIIYSVLYYIILYYIIHIHICVCF